MIVLEAKLKGKTEQYSLIDEAIRTALFVRNKALRLWMDNTNLSGYDLSKYCAVLAKEFDFANRLNAQARQASAERAWSAIARFYKNCKNKIGGKKGYPQFKGCGRSLEYKQTGWKLSKDRKYLNLTDGFKIGRLKLVGSRDLNFYQIDQIKRVRLIKRADGHYVQFCIKADRAEQSETTGKVIGLDVGIKEFYTDSNGDSVPNPKFLRKAEKRIKRAQRLVSRKKKGSANRKKAIKVLGKRHLKVSRQRKDHAVKLARCVITSNDVVVYEDLKISNLLKNHCLAKSISDASWYQFKTWLEYFGRVFGKLTIPVNPAYTSQKCSNCGAIVKKTLSTRTHSCKCGCQLDRDHNAAINILQLGLKQNRVGHTQIHACGEFDLCQVDVSLLGKLSH